MKVFEYKERFNIPQAASAVDDQQLWRFSADEVFGCHLDGFLNQLYDLRTIFESAVSFQNLEKLEISGIRGKLLTDQVKQVR